MTTAVSWKIGENKIYVPLPLLRALAGMACGTIVYFIFRHLCQYSYTQFAKKGGTLLSFIALCMGLWLSARGKEHAVNSYGWRSILVVLLYATALLLAFTFSQDIIQNQALKKLCCLGGKYSLSIYMVHLLVIYTGIHLGIPYGKKFWLVVFIGTALATVLIECGASILRLGWAAFVTWLKKRCIVSPTETH